MKKQSPSWYLRRMAEFYNCLPYPRRPLWAWPHVNGSPRARYSHWNGFLPNGAAVPRIALVGCGTDEPLLFRVLHTQSPMDAFDLSARSLKIAQRKVNFYKFFHRKYFGSERYFNGDAAQLLNAHKNTYHYMQCFGVLHHQPEPKILFQAMVEALAPGGILRLMVYASTGRRLERRIQSQNNFWTQGASRGMRFFYLMIHAWKWVLGRVFSFFIPGKRAFYRFRYVGHGVSHVADAFLHPSDHALPLKTILKWAQELGLKSIYWRVKVYEKGWIDSNNGEGILSEQVIDWESQDKLASNVEWVFALNP